MAQDDIAIGVGLDLGNFTPQVDLLESALGFITDQAQAAIQDFGALEQQALALGTTVGALAGINKDVADTYRKQSDAVNELNTSLQAIRIDAFEATVAYSHEMQRSLAETGKRYLDLGHDVEGAIPILTKFNDLIFNSDRRNALFESGLQSVASITALDALVAATTGRDSAVGGLATTPTAVQLEDRGFVHDRNQEREDQIQFDILSGPLFSAEQRLSDFQDRIAQQNEINSQVSGIRRDVFEQSQAIDRESLQRQLAFNLSTPGIPLEELQRRNDVKLAQFDERQRASAAKFDLRADSRAQEAQIRTESHTSKMVEEIEGLRADFAEFLSNSSLMREVPTLESIN